MSKSHVSRRDFAKHLVLGTGASVVGLAAGPARADDAPKQPAEAPPSQPTEWEDLQLAALLRTYPGEHLTEDMIAGIRRDLRRRRVQSGILREYALKNSDAPSFVFAAYRRDEA